jgi:hypothetical protein
MPVTIVKEKKQQKRSTAVAEALATLGELLLFQKLAIKVRKETATPVEKRQYNKLKTLVWAKAERRYAKVTAAVPLNGPRRRTREQVARSAWRTRRRLYGETGHP